MGNAASVGQPEPYSSGDARATTTSASASSTSGVRLNNFVDKDNTSRLQREISQTSEARSEPSSDVIFETFYNRQGKSFTVMRRGSIRFYLDLPSGTWRDFPSQWVNEGIFVEENRNDVDLGNIPIPKLFDDQTRLEHNLNREVSRVRDDREGFVNHSKRGKLLTYIFEHRRHIHCYYDVQQHAWIKLPICWELTVDLVKNFVDGIQRQCPDWTDKEDILACLRASNYNVEDCVATYLVVKDWLGLNQNQSRRASNTTTLTVTNQLRSPDDTQNTQGLRDQLSQLRTQWTTAVRERDAAVEEGQRARAEASRLRDELSRLSEDDGRAAASSRERDSGASQGQDEATVLARLQRTLKVLREESQQMKERLRREQEAVERQLEQLCAASLKLKSRIAEMTGEMEYLRANYEREAMERKLLYNQFQELRGNIRVFCRCRRILPQDEHAGEGDDDGEPIGKPGSHLRFLSDSEIKLRTSGFERVFRFDHVFEPNATQEDVYSEIAPIITSCADGYNVCIVAYGQTGSGKTFTMEGTKDSDGICPRAINELLSICRSRESITYTLKLSALEIYNDSIQDLLTPEVTALEIRASKDSKVVVAGLTELIVEKQSDIIRHMKFAAQNRKVASTKMNSQSSRSHLVVGLRIIAENKLTNLTTCGLLQLCDLAGSERTSKTHAEGQRLVEANAINKSLSALGQVFMALKNSQMHIPFRNSKLTHLLQPCLSGDAKMVMIATINPDAAQLQETVNTLQFSSNCCQIALGPNKQNFM